MKMNFHQLKQIQLAIMVIVSLLLVYFVVSGIASYDDHYSVAETERVEALIERYVIQCYATEGAYPPNIQYLVEHYGLIINEDKYIYEYEPVAENIKPMIQIFVRLDYD
jgi:hypothetical protein